MPRRRDRDNRKKEGAINLTNQNRAALNNQEKHHTLGTLLLALLCLQPAEDSPSPVASAPAALAAPAQHHAILDTLPASVEQAISEAEYTERKNIETSFFDERVQIDALFCALANKLRGMQDALEDYQLVMCPQRLFICSMAMNELFECEESNRVVIETAGHDEVEELEILFRDDGALKSQSQLFQPAAPAAASKPGGWMQWLFKQ